MWRTIHMLEIQSVFACVVCNEFTVIVSANRAKTKQNGRFLGSSRLALLVSTDTYTDTSVNAKHECCWCSIINCFVYSNIWTKEFGDPSIHECASHNWIISEKPTATSHIVIWYLVCVYDVMYYVFGVYFVYRTLYRRMIWTVNASTMSTLGMAL